MTLGHESWDSRFYYIALGLSTSNGVLFVWAAGIQVCFFWERVAQPVKDGCTDFNVALEVGKKIKVLEVAKCQASSDEDKHLAPGPMLFTAKPIRNDPVYSLRGETGPTGCSSFPNQS